MILYDSDIRGFIFYDISILLSWVMILYDSDIRGFIFYDISILLSWVMILYDSDIRGFIFYDISILLNVGCISIQICMNRNKQHFYLKKAFSVPVKISYTCNFVSFYFKHSIARVHYPGFPKVFP